MVDHQQRRYGQKTTSILIHSDLKVENPPIPTPPPTNATIGKAIPALANDMGRYPGRGFRPQNVW